jgi:hypothetical protein
MMLMLYQNTNYLLQIQLLYTRQLVDMVTVTA